MNTTNHQIAPEGVVTAPPDVRAELPPSGDGRVELLRLMREMDDDTQVDVKHVAAHYGIHTNTVWRAVKAGTIPPPVRLGHRTLRWRLGTIREQSRALPVAA